VVQCVLAAAIMPTFTQPRFVEYKLDVYADITTPVLDGTRKSGAALPLHDM
jgi:hypothetical protein